VRERLTAVAVAVALSASLPAHAQTDAPDAGAAPAPDATLAGALESFPLGSGASLSIRAPRDWSGRAEQNTSLAEQLAQIDGARVVFSRVWKPATVFVAPDGRSFSDAMQLVCVEADVADWAPGAHLLVFDRMNGFARAELSKGASLDTFDPGVAEDAGLLYRQRFTAHGELEPKGAKGEKLLVEDNPNRPHNHAKIHGVHVLSSYAGSRTMVGCTLSCGETERPDQSAYVCAAAASSLALQGELALEPEFTLLGRFLRGVRVAPWLLGGMIVGMVLALAGALVLGKTLLESMAAKRSA